MESETAGQGTQQTLTSLKGDGQNPAQEKTRENSLATACKNAGIQYETVLVLYLGGPVQHAIG